MRHTVAAFITPWDAKYTDVQVTNEKVVVSCGFSGLQLHNGTSDEPMSVQEFRDFLATVVQQIDLAVEAFGKAAA